jgi:predicted hydrolase (HD superfamily)
MESNKHAEQMLRAKALELGIDLYKYQNTTYLHDDDYGHLINDPIENAYMFYAFLTDTEETTEGEI